MHVGYYTIDENANEKVEFSFVSFLSALQKMKFVNTVLAFVCHSDKVYYPFLRNIAFDYAVVKMFAQDIDITDILGIDENNPTRDNYVVLAEELSARTDIASIIKNALPQTLIAELSIAVNNNIEIQIGLHKDILSDALAGLLITADQKLKNINLEEITGLAKNMSSIAGDITPDKVLKTFAESNIHKDGMNEIVGEKNQKIKDLQGKVTDFLKESLKKD